MDEMPKNPIPPPRPASQGHLNIKKVLPFIYLTASVGLLLLGGYFLLAKFLNDRQLALGFAQMPPRTQRRASSTQPQVKTYTQKDLEEMRKKGTLPPGVGQQPINPAMTNQDAVQRSLKTLEEINRINEMNRRLMEEQRRMQEQR